MGRVNGQCAVCFGTCLPKYLWARRRPLDFTAYPDPSAIAPSFRRFPIPGERTRPRRLADVHGFPGRNRGRHPACNRFHRAEKVPWYQCRTWGGSEDKERAFPERRSAQALGRATTPTPTAPVAPVLPGGRYPVSGSLFEQLVDGVLPATRRPGGHQNPWGSSGPLRVRKFALRALALKMSGTEQPRLPRALSDCPTLSGAYLYVRIAARRASTSSMIGSGTVSRRCPFRAARSRVRG